ncbi:MAG: c-type cytochrome [Holophagaceae bacterium]|uniref:C-type cytochrome n=1 Tax=Candidatus Geothrix odensensis TaxID=2954440 RepID=A0A936K7T7_9BACT|nr:c-type cytochrome [Candidatus Geothrix odensensis]
MIPSSARVWSSSYEAQRLPLPGGAEALASALLLVLGFIAIAAFFGFTVVPGLRYQAHTTDTSVQAVQGETGWLDPTEYPAVAREVIPPIDPKTVMTPNPELLARGKALYDQNCATCHGAEGKAMAPPARAQSQATQFRGKGGLEERHPGRRHLQDPGGGHQGQFHGVL